jgi:hypothetical protein
MGVLGAVVHSPEALEVDFQWIESEIVERPYGIDVIVPATYAGSEGGGYTLEYIRQLWFAPDFVGQNNLTHVTVSFVGLYERHGQSKAMRRLTVLMSQVVEPVGGTN